MGLREHQLVPAAVVVAGRHSPELLSRQYTFVGIARGPIGGCLDIDTDAATQRSAVPSRLHSKPNIDAPLARQFFEPPMK